MMRFLGILLLAAGLVAVYGRDYLDIGLPEGDLKSVGFVLIAVGGVIYVLGKRRRRRGPTGEKVERVSKTSNIGYRNPEPEPEPEIRKPAITWGRDGDRD